MGYLALVVLGVILALPMIGVGHWVAVGAAAAWIVIAVWGLVAIHRPGPFDI